MHIQKPSAPRRRVVTKRHLIVPALGLAIAGFGPASSAVAQGAIGPKSPAPAPIAPAPHVVTPPTLPPPVVAPTVSNPLGNQPHTSGQDDTKRSTSDTGSQPTPAKTATGRRQYEPLLNVPVTVANKTGGSPTRVVTDSNGNFDFGKLAPGSYTLDFPFTATINGAVTNTGIVSATGGNQVSRTVDPISGTLVGDLTHAADATTGTINASGGGANGAHPQAVLIGLLLPAVQKAREDNVAVSLVHAIPADRTTNIRANLTIGKDGGVQSFDFGDGKGPVDLRKEATTIPLPKGTQPGDVRGTLTYTGATTVNAGTPLAADRQHEPFIVVKEFLSGVRVAAGDINGDGRPDFKTNTDGTFEVAKLAPGNYLLGITDNDSPRPKDRPFLVSLLLPAVQPAREASIIEHRFPSADDALNISLRMGRDGRIMALNFGDGKGPVDLAKETRYLPLPQDPSPGMLKLSLASATSTATPHAIDGPISSVPVGIDHEPGGNLAVSKTDSHGGFAFTKVGTGVLTLTLNPKDIVVGAGPGGGPQKIVAVLIGLLLPADATASGNYVEHAFTGASASGPIKIALRIGKDGRVMSIDWGDGPIDPAKEARTLPLQQGMPSGEFSGKISIFDRWGNL